MNRDALVPTCILAFAFVLPTLAESPNGIKNFHQVNQNVYRGGQPNEAGFEQLAKLGVKTVIDLREAGQRSLNEAKAVTAAGMKYVNVPMTGLTPPSESEIHQILALLGDTANGSVFVHCMRGADRTGAVIAAYRIYHDHWTNSQALNEAKALGMSFFQLPRKNFILGFQTEAAPAATATPVASVR